MLAHFYDLPCFGQSLAVALNNCISSGLELQLRQPRIKAAGGDERLVRAFFDDAALFQHEDAVA
jgi:hypothetical protein